MSTDHTNPHEAPGDPGLDELLHLEKALECLEASRSLEHERVLILRREFEQLALAASQDAVMDKMDEYQAALLQERRLASASADVRLVLDHNGWEEDTVPF